MFHPVYIPYSAVVCRKYIVPLINPEEDAIYGGEKLKFHSFLTFHYVALRNDN
jgi:hypothetical protein